MWRRLPCYCNPDVPNGIECPYCRFPSQDGELLCSRDGESISFIDLNGQDQICSCEVPSDPSSDPISNCNSGSPSGGVNGNDNYNDDNDNWGGTSGVCTLELESGQIVTLSPGESYGNYIETRCGSSQEFPCFCNPELKNKMECPYCGFVQAGGDLLCTKHQEVVTFNDGQDEQTCSCEIPSDPNQDPIQICFEGDVPPPTSTPPENDEDDENENDNDITGCSINDLDGNVVTIPNGNSFGDLVKGICGNSYEWPAYCNTNLDSSVVSRTGSESFDTIEYPYCVYSDTISGEPTCAGDNEQIVYVNSFSEEVECSCSYQPSGLGGAQSTCQPADDSNPIEQPSNPPATTFFPNSRASSVAFWKAFVLFAAASVTFVLP